MSFRGSQSDVSFTAAVAAAAVVGVNVIVNVFFRECYRKCFFRECYRNPCFVTHVFVNVRVTQYIYRNGVLLAQQVIVNGAMS